MTNVTERQMRDGTVFVLALCAALIGMAAILGCCGAVFLKLLLWAKDTLGTETTCGL